MEVSCTVESDSGLCRTIRNLGAWLYGVCESSLRTRKYVSSPTPTRGTSVYDKRNSRDAKYDRGRALGNRRNTSRRVIRDESVAEETIGVRVSDHKRAVQTVKRLRSQPEIGLRFRPLPTKMCVLVNTDSALHNAEADNDEEGSDDEWLAKAKQKGIRVRSQQWCIGVCGGSGRSGEN